MEISVLESVVKVVHRYSYDWSQCDLSTLPSNTLEGLLEVINKGCNWGWFKKSATKEIWFEIEVDNDTGIYYTIFLVVVVF
ncbi:MAG: hypothetical protein HWN81_00650 [Candidatus Lokiarchaeota archaeon]|nr:hypothetical protein [Candidatus Lokiarchaeota archaeon]